MRKFTNLTMTGEEQYLFLLHELVELSKIEQKKDDRTGVGVYGTFGNCLNFDLSKGLPLMTTKKMWFRGIFEELKWMLSGSSNINDLPEDVREIWKPWADESGSLGRTYGVQWRYQTDFDELPAGSPTFDQINYVVDQIRSNPNSRRIVMNTWLTAEVDQTKLPWCHGSVIQFFVKNGKLSMATYQRSADTFIGLPWNIAFYGLFLEVISNVTGYEAGELTYFVGDTHLYSNHVNAATEQLNRSTFEFPKLKIKKKLWYPDLEKLNYEDFELIDYKYHPGIKAEIAV